MTKAKIYVERLNSSDVNNLNSEIYLLVTIKIITMSIVAQTAYIIKAWVISLFLNIEIKLINTDQFYFGII